MKTQHASSASLWDNANRRTKAENGMGDPADALHPMVTIKQLIASIGTNPAALELLAGRAHELTPEQRTAALKAHGAAAPKVRRPKARKAAKVEPVARPGLSGLSLLRLGFGRGARS